MSRVLEISSIDDLQQFRLLWKSQHAQTPRATFFQSFEWLETYWRHYGESQQLRVLIVESCGQTIGILPLVVRRERTRAGLVRMLTYPLDDWGSTFAPLGKNPTATLLVGLRHIQRSTRDWDVIDLRWINAGRDNGRTRRAMQTLGMRPQTLKQNVAPHVDFELDCGGDWDAYWSGRTRKWRESIRYNRKRLAKQGQLRFERYRPQGSAHGDDDPRFDLYADCERIAARSWQGDSTTGTTLSHASVQAFLRDVHVTAARAGSLDMNVLYLDEQPLAFSYNYVYEGYLHCLRTGFDPHLSRNGPAAVMIWHMLQDGCQRGDRAYDLGVDYLEPKSKWSTRDVLVERCCHYPAFAPQAQALRLKRWASHRFGRVKA